MGKPPRRSSNVTFVLLMILLALVCVGGAELVASYFFAPDLFHKVTAPVRSSVSAVATFCSNTASELSTHLAGLFIEKPASEVEVEIGVETVELPDSQAADKPLLETLVEIADPSITELKRVGGKDILTGGNVEIEYFNQTVEPWASQPFGRDDIARYGCGPTAMAMVVNSISDHRTDPAQMAEWAVDNHHWASKSGSYLSIVQGAAQAFGLTARSVQEKTVEGLRTELLSGNIMVALMGPGHFTKGGHFILIHGVTLSGSFLVADPSSVDRSLMEWEPELIINELSKSTSNGAPLWAISYW